MGRVCDYFARRSRRLRIENANATPSEKKKNNAIILSPSEHVYFFSFSPESSAVFFRPTGRPRLRFGLTPRSAVTVTVTIELSFYRFVFATRAPTRSGVRPKTVRNGEHPRGESRTGSVPQSPTVLKKEKKKTIFTANNIAQQRTGDAPRAVTRWLAEPVIRINYDEIDVRFLRRNALFARIRR